MVECLYYPLQINWVLIPPMQPFKVHVAEDHLYAVPPAVITHAYMYVSPKLAKGSLYSVI